jgi:hypothetical protein
MTNSLAPANNARLESRAMTGLYTADSSGVVPVFDEEACANLSINLNDNNYHLSSQHLTYFENKPCISCVIYEPMLMINMTFYSWKMIGLETHGWRIMHPYKQEMIE